MAMFAYERCHGHAKRVIPPRRKLICRFFLLRRPLARLTIDARAELICPSQTAFGRGLLFVEAALPCR